MTSTRPRGALDGHDLWEGLTEDGVICTGARRDRIPATFAALLGEAVELVGWSDGASTADSGRSTQALDATIERIVAQFRADIGLWPD